MDPFENNTVAVNQSSIGFGEGLFTKRNIEEGELISFYSGFIITPNVSIPFLWKKKEVSGRISPWGTVLNLRKNNISIKIFPYFVAFFSKSILNFWTNLKNMWGLSKLSKELTMAILAMQLGSGIQE